MMEIELSKLAKERELPRLEPILVGENIYFVNELFGVRLSRGHNNYVMFTILVKDDGFWHEPSSSTASSHWMDDLHDVLWAARGHLNTNLFEKTQWGYKYK